MYKARFHFRVQSVFLLSHPIAFSFLFTFFTFCALGVVSLMQKYRSVIFSHFIHVDWLRDAEKSYTSRRFLFVLHSIMQSKRKKPKAQSHEKKNDEKEEWKLLANVNKVDSKIKKNKLFSFSSNKIYHKSVMTFASPTSAS